MRLPDGLDPFGEAPGRAFIVSGPDARRWPASSVIGRVGGDALVIEGLLELAVSELRAARERRPGRMGLGPLLALNRKAGHPRYASSERSS